MGKLLNNGTLQLPAPKTLPNSNIICPHFLLGDNGFGAKPFLIIPFTRNENLTLAKKVFNYRHSRARRIIECSFGLLTQKWRVFQGGLGFSIKNSEDIVMATVALQNFLLTNEMALEPHMRRYIYNGNNISDAPEINENDDIAEEIEEDANEIREKLVKYFASPAGAVHWQYNAAINN